MGILLSDYFFHDLVRATVWDVFRQIKYRARIRVPDSWTLVGVLDEHEILQPGEVMGLSSPCPRMRQLISTQRTLKILKIRTGISSEAKS